MSALDRQNLVLKLFPVGLLTHLGAWVLTVYALMNIPGGQELNPISNLYIGVVPIGLLSACATALALYFVLWHFAFWGVNNQLRIVNIVAVGVTTWFALDFFIDFIQIVGNVQL